MTMTAKAVRRSKGGGFSSSSSETNNRFYKTRLCPFHFSSAGGSADGKSRCRGGNDCSYAHSWEELRPSVDLTKTKLCVEYVNGWCMKKAEDCPFAHGHRDLRSSESVRHFPSVAADGKSPVISKGDLCEHSSQTSTRKATDVSSSAALDIDAQGNVMRLLHNGGIPSFIGGSGAACDSDFDQRPRRLYFRSSGGGGTTNQQPTGRPREPSNTSTSSDHEFSNLMNQIVSGLDDHLRVNPLAVMCGAVDAEGRLKQ